MQLRVITLQDERFCHVDDLLAYLKTEGQGFLPRRDDVPLTAAMRATCFELVQSITQAIEQASQQNNPG